MVFENAGGGFVLVVLVVLHGGLDLVVAGKFCSGHWRREEIRD